MTLNYSSVMIVTYGRSGSTLLQGILNSMDGVVVRGENNNFCFHLFSAYRSLVWAKRNHGLSTGSTSPTSAWFGAHGFDEDRFFADARQLVMRQLDPDDSHPACIGFKEIRYLAMDMRPRTDDSQSGLHAYLDFLAKLFPRPAFIFLTRSHDEVVRSAWWRKKDPTQLKKRLSAFESEVSRYAQTNPHTFFISYQQMVQGGSQLRGLFSFLGATFDEERVASVMQVPHSTTLEVTPAQAGPSAKSGRNHN